MSPENVSRPQRPAASRRLKMLFLAEEFPLPIASGSNIRKMNLLQRFAADFEVTLLTIATRPHAAHLEELSGHVHRLVPIVPMNKRSPLHQLAFKALFCSRRLVFADSPEFFYNNLANIRTAIEAELARESHDVVFCCYWYWPKSVLETPGLKVIDTNDVQWQRLERQLEQTRNPLDRALKRRLVANCRDRESRTLRRADVVVAISEADQREFKALLGGKSEQILIPTGLDDTFFSASGTAPVANHIAFYGALSNPMNRDAVRFLAESILPRIRERVPDVHLALVGASPSREALALAQDDSAVSVTGYVADIRQPLAQASVVILPLRFAYGIRGRVFEVMSMGIPLVATSVAVHGMGLSPGEGFLLADTPEDFAEAVSKLLRDPELRAEIAARGQEFVRRHRSIEATYGRLSTFLAQRCQRHRPSSAGDAPPA